MARPKKDDSREGPAPKTPEDSENHMILLAEKEAERQIREGTASSQIIVHYLKLATENTKLERAKLVEENKLLRARTQQVENAAKIEELYANAIAAMTSYRPKEVDYDDPDSY